LDTGDKADAVACAAAIAEIEGSIVDSGALVEEVAASATFTPERTNARMEDEYMLTLVELESGQLMLGMEEEQLRSFNSPFCEAAVIEGK
jgi:hypothetical protein